MKKNIVCTLLVVAVVTTVTPVEARRWSQYDAIECPEGQTPYHTGTGWRCRSAGEGEPSEIYPSGRPVRERLRERRHRRSHHDVIQCSEGKTPVQKADTGGWVCVEAMPGEPSVVYPNE